MLAGLTSRELTEIEAYSHIEADPEGEEARKQRQQIEEQARLDKLKTPFTRIAEAADDNRSDP